MIKYEITKPNDDIKQATITKSGHTHDLTIADVISHIEQLIKMKKEMQGNMYMARAFMHNIEKNHPYVKKLDEKQLDTLFIYGQKSNDEKDAASALNLIEEQMQKYDSLATDLAGQIKLPKDSELHKAIAEYKAATSETKAAFDKAFNESKNAKISKAKKSA